ncbi:MAG TPA: DUF2752 domain-containing protein [Propionibacteriaceae bacterium]|nr:DUF2752 domain-containing protein [Propionibacteriaceae bacterium]
MAAASSDAGPRSAARSGLPVTSGILAGGLAVSALFATTGIGLPCPFLALTGWQCPLCGGTRMGSALLHADLGAAFAANPLALVAVVVLVMLTLAWTVELLGGPAVRLPQRLSRRLRRVPTSLWLVAAAVAATAYAVVRNLV